MSDDHVMVQPIKTFLKGQDLVHPESEPFPTSRFHAEELRRNGLVVHVAGEPAPAAPAEPGHAAAVASDPVVPAHPAPPANPATPRRRGRPPGKRS
ncbi:hypothetical protein ACRBEV_10160 [Methylobacterium phyllosphaerae]